MKANNLNAIGKWKRSESAGSLPSSRGSVWTNNSDSIELTEQILVLIDSAERSLWIASPFIDDERIVDALQRAKSRRVRVKLITDIRNNRGRGKLYTTRGFQSKPAEANSLEKHQACIRELVRSRISCRSPTHYPHFKLIIADDRRGLLSSANLTGNSLGGKKDCSLEVGITIDCSELVGQFVAVVANLWDSCPFRLLIDGGDVSIEQQGRCEQVASIAELAERKNVLVNSPGENYFSLTNAIVNVVRQSKVELTFISMSFFEPNRVPRLEQALLEALSRNVEITAVVRPEHFRRAEEKGEYPDPSLVKLIKAGLQLRGIAGLHAKGLAVDQSRALIFSANINPYSLTSEFESNHMEMGVSLSKGDDGFESFSEFISDARHAAIQQFVLRNA